MTIQDLQGNLHATDGKFTHKPAGIDNDANQSLPEDESEDSNVVFVDVFDDREFEVDRPTPDDDQYAVYEGDEQRAIFDYSGDPEDHDEIWSQALGAMEEAGVIRLCAGCRAEPPEGDDPVCASCY